MNFFCYKKISPILLNTLSPITLFSSIKSNKPFLKSKITINKELSELHKPNIHELTFMIKNSPLKPHKYIHKFIDNYIHLNNNNAMFSIFNDLYNNNKKLFINNMLSLNYDGKIIIKNNYLSIFILFNTNNIKILNQYNIKNTINESYNNSQSDDIDYLNFIKKTDGQDILYHGGSSYDLQNYMFFSDYYKHAHEYGDFLNGIYINPNDILFINNNIYELIKNQYKNLNLNDIISLKPYKDLINNNTLSINDAKLALSTLNSNQKYSDISQNFTINNTLVPIFLDYAKKTGKNIIGYLGGDYYDYGGQNEFVVYDISKYKTLRNEYLKNIKK